MVYWSILTTSDWWFPDILEKSRNPRWWINFRILEVTKEAYSPDSDWFPEFFVPAHKFDYLLFRKYCTKESSLSFIFVRQFEFNFHESNLINVHTCLTMASAFNKYFIEACWVRILEYWSIINSLRASKSKQMRVSLPKCRIVLFGPPPYHSPW